MPRYGRDFSRFRDDEDRYSDRGGMPRRGGFGGRWGSGGGRGFGQGGMQEGGFSGTYDDDPGFRGGSSGGYPPGGWNRGYEGREEGELGGYERGMGDEWGARDGWQGGSMGRGFGGQGRGYGGYDEPRGGWGGDEPRRGRGGGDELRRLRAADIMTENPECVTPDVSLADAARKMRDLDVGIIPVVDSEGSRRLRGVITDRDIAIRAVADGRDANSTRVSEVMTTGVESCNKNDPVQSVLRLMEREQVRRVPITDREGRLVGIVAQADVATELDDSRSEQRVADTLERISEPSRGGGRGGQGRGRDGMYGRSSAGLQRGMEPGAERGGQKPEENL